ncbi:stabilization of polarity axis-domain-containing protein [Mycena olivaceomarginata]|nr:stabilization of polarity axis-domain-containing protein [Mycena olivaceomarginata]
MAKDTHFYHTTVVYKDHPLPIKMPLAMFPEEVGEYSPITLIKVFSSQALVSSPQHPHLHTNVPQTHPTIILFNALVTGKHIIFVGYQKPAGKVSSFVLLACALGCAVHGFIERAFPYANLNNRDEWEACIARPVFIAGITNPIFKSLGLGVPNMVRTATFNTEMSLGSEEDIVRSANAKEGAKADFTKADNNAEYVLRFVRLASRFEEDTTGTTKFGYPSHAYNGRVPNPRLGSGIFNDESAGQKELAANLHRNVLFRMQNTKTLSDPEVSEIMRTLAENIKTYDQVIELLAYLMFHGGLLHLAFCLFHQKESVRDATVDLFD